MLSGGKHLMATLEQLEKNKVKVTFTVTAERFREGLQHSYNKNKNSVAIDGFRKGKAPRKLIERMYGKDFFYNDALDFVLPKAYDDACDELDLAPVYRPSINRESADEESGAAFTAEIYVKPEASIEGYYGISYKKQDTEANDSDIQERLQREREKNSRLVSVERPAEMGDMLTINFTGYVDGEPFEGGESKDYDITLGSHNFIDTFEDQLVGHEIGDDVTVNVRFPDEYHHENLAGMDAVFEVEILDIKTKEYPEIDDDFAQDVSEFDTLAEYRESLAALITKDKTAQAENAKRQEVIKKLGAMVEVDVPEVMYEARIDDMMEDFELSLRYQGMPMETYFNYSNETPEHLRETWRDTAVIDVKAALALEALAKKEGIEVSDDEFKEYIEKNTRQGQNADKLIASMTGTRKKEIRSSILSQKALDFVVENAIPVEENELPEVI
jgi:trigger factor